MCLLLLHDIYTNSSLSILNTEDKQMHKSHGGRTGNENKLRMYMDKQKLSAIISAV